MPARDDAQAGMGMRVVHTAASSVQGHAFQLFGHPAAPAQFMVDPAAQRIGRVRLTVGDVGHLRLRRCRAQPGQQLLAVGVTRETLHRHDFGLDGHFPTEDAQRPLAAHQGRTAGTAGLKAGQQYRVARILAERQPDDAGRDRRSACRWPR